MTKTAQTKHAGTEGHTHSLHPRDFPRFIDYLGGQLHLPPAQQAVLAQAAPAQLYSLATTLNLPPRQLAQALATFCQLPYLAQITPREVQHGGLSASFCRAHLVVALHHPTGYPAFALCNPFDFELLDLLNKQASTLLLYLTTPDVLNGVLAHVDHPTSLASSSGRTSAVSPHLTDTTYDFLSSGDPEGVAEIDPQVDYEVLSPSEVEKIGQLPPIIRLVNLILTDAVKAGASDIHVEPQEAIVQVRYRIDGVLVDAIKVPKHLQPSLISRFKIIAQLDISEHRKPQDGRSRLRFENRRIDLRVSTLPTQLGQKVVIRLLDNSSTLLHLDQLSFTEDIQRAFEQLLLHAQGMILVTGPTGSGKTTTLYAALNWLKSPMKNIVTVENPVEFQIPGLTQVQIDPKAGMTFAAGLRSILRQDPDIILVGEIRDRETAGVAAEASQTGHLLLSTLHTNDAPTTITRLIDLDIEPFKIASSLTGILAQRLLRQVCPFCSVAYEPPAKVLAELQDGPPLPPHAQWKTAKGCDACYQSGFKGRVAIHELLVMTEDLRELITQKVPDHVIRNAARQHGMRTLHEDGIAKAALGLTTLEEVWRVAPRLATRQAPVPLVSGGARQSASHPPAVAAPSVAAPPAPPAGQPHLLVLEDDADTQALLQMYLDKEGYAVTLANDGIEAFLHLGKQHFDLILSDINMPNLDGIKLLELKNQKGITTPVIFLTADSTAAQEQKCLELGAIDYIQKPLQKAILLLRIKRALGR
jgi:type IV pilus assembly protein PilB